MIPEGVPLRWMASGKPHEIASGIMDIALLNVFAYTDAHFDVLLGSYFEESTAPTYSCDTVFFAIVLAPFA
jgi:hypothetical protein